MSGEDLGWAIRVAIRRLVAVETRIAEAVRQLRRPDPRDVERAVQRAEDLRALLRDQRASLG